jgi:hypothetical protein
MARRCLVILRQAIINLHHNNYHRLPFSIHYSYIYATFVKYSSHFVLVSVKVQVAIDKDDCKTDESSYFVTIIHSCKIESVRNPVDRAELAAALFGYRRHQSNLLSTQPKPSLLAAGSPIQQPAV